MSEEELVFTKAVGRKPMRVYHTDENCHRLQLADTVLEKPLNSLHDDVKLCTICGDGYDHDGGDTSYQETLERLRKQRLEEGEA